MELQGLCVMKIWHRQNVSHNLREGLDFSVDATIQAQLDSVIEGYLNYQEASIRNSFRMRKDNLIGTQFLFLRGILVLR